MKTRYLLFSAPQGKEGWSKGDLVKHSTDIYMIAESDSNPNVSWQAQHLYICSETEEIKGGDWFWNIWESKVDIYLNEEVNACSNKSDRIKICFTTDPKCNLPKISLELIRSYAESGGQMKYCYLEMVSGGTYQLQRNGTEMGYRPDVPKLTDNNECIVAQEGSDWRERLKEIKEIYKDVPSRQPTEPKQSNEVMSANDWFKNVFVNESIHDFAITHLIEKYAEYYHNAKSQQQDVKMEELLDWDEMKEQLKNQQLTPLNELGIIWIVEYIKNHIKPLKKSSNGTTDNKG